MAGTEPASRDGKAGPLPIGIPGQQGFAAEDFPPVAACTSPRGSALPLPLSQLKEQDGATDQQRPGRDHEYNDDQEFR